MKNMKKVLDSVLEKIKPEKTKLEEADSFLEKLNKSLKKLRIPAKADFGGSFAKGTFLKQDHDIDIFVKFSLRFKEKNLSDILEKALKGFSPERVHGSRDYFIVKNKFNFEIVPVLDIKKPEDAENVTDFSPWHARWFNINGAKYRNGVMLAKKFCKSAGVYGAESYIGGFSGHVIDIVVVYYKGFIPMLKASLKWKKKQVIDFYNKHRGKALFELNRSKTTGNLIVIDPVQPDRNASAALSDSKLALFRKKAGEFLRSPSEKFFDKKRIDKEKLINEGAVIIEAYPKGSTTESKGTKLEKAFNFVKKGLSEFNLKSSGWEWDKDGSAIFWYVPGKKSVEKEKEWPGPLASMKKHAAEFRKKHRKVSLKKGRLFAKVKRKHTTPESLVHSLAKESYFIERVKRCRIL